MVGVVNIVIGMLFSLALLNFRNPNCYGQTRTAIH
jgi:hypothetical protein